MDSSAFVQILVEWFESGYELEKMKWSLCPNGYCLHPNQSAETNLYFIGDAFLSLVENRSEVGKRISNTYGEQIDELEEEERVEVFTQNPTLETKKLLRRWNAHKSQVLYALSSSTHLFNVTNERGTGQLPHEPDDGIWIEPLQPEALPRYLEIQSAIENDPQLNSDEVVPEQNLRSMVRQRMNRPAFKHYLVRLGTKTIGAFATSFHHLAHSAPTGSNNSRSDTFARPSQALALFDFGVIPEFRGQAIGKSIVGHWLEQARSENAFAAIFARDPLVDYYTSLGFETVAKFERWTNTRINHL